MEHSRVGDPVVCLPATSPNHASSSAPLSAGPASWDVDLRQLIRALSDALDLVGIDDVGHGKRVGIMAVACARELGVPDQEGFLFDLGSLHDIGVSSTRVHGHLVAEIEWEGSQSHCEIGHRLLKDFAPLAALAEPILHHHTRWEHLRGHSGIFPDVARTANLIFLVDRVDALAASHYADQSLLMNVGAIRDAIAVRSGSLFAPDLVEVFLRASAQEAFWLDLDPRGVQFAVEDLQLRSAPYRATISELRQLAEIFARIVDAKSPFTAQHSLGVAGLARLIAERMGVPTLNCDKIEIAGLLHDLGKLRVPDEILDKPAKLDPRERAIINGHSFETHRILRHIQGFQEIALWAACHHEEPDGTGYPFHKRSAELPLEARILRVADIFQAMAQDRPYRRGLQADAVRALLDDLVSAGRAEADIVAAATSDMAEAMAAARSAASHLGPR